MKTKLWLLLAVLSSFSLGAAVSSAGGTVDPPRVTSLAPAPLDQLADEAVVIAWVKYLGDNTVQRIKALKGYMPERVIVGADSQLSLDLPEGQVGLVFFGDRDTWKPLKRTVFTVKAVSGPSSGPLLDGLVGARDPQQLLRDITPEMKRRLYDIPMDRPGAQRSFTTPSLGNLVDKLTDEQDAPPAMPVESFGSILNGILKVQTALRHGDSIPDFYAKKQAQPEIEVPEEFDLAPHPAVTKPVRSAAPRDRQICPPGATDVSVDLVNDGFAPVPFTNFSFPINGAVYDGLFIHPDGYVSFGAPWYASWFPGYSAPTPYYFFNDCYYNSGDCPAVIAPLWCWMYPDGAYGGGGVSYLEVSADEFIVCFDYVETYNWWTYNFNGWNAFLLHLYSDGSFTFEYVETWADRALAGWKVNDRDTTASGDWDFTLYDGSVLGDGTQKHWYDTIENNLTPWLDGVTVSFAGNPTGAYTADIYKPNDTPANAPAVTLPFASKDGCRLGGVDYFRVDLPNNGSLYYLESFVRSSRVLHFNAFDTILGLFDADGQLMVSNDDDPNHSKTDSTLKAVIPPGTYYIGVTAWPDDAFTGLHADSGYYGLNIDAYETSTYPIYLEDDDFVPVWIPFDFPFVKFWDYWAKNMIFVGSNGYTTLWDGDTEYEPSDEAWQYGPPRMASWWTDISDYYWWEDPMPVWIGLSADAVQIEWEGWQWWTDDLIWIAQQLWFDGEIVNFNYSTSEWGSTGWGLGLGFTPHQTDLYNEFMTHSVRDLSWGSSTWVLGTGWETYMYEIFDNYSDLPEPNRMVYFGCYPYDYMAYSNDGLFLYLNAVPTPSYYGLRLDNMFRFMNQPGGYVTNYVGIDYEHLERSLTVMTPGDGLLHFTAGALAPDSPYYIWGFFWMDPYWGYGYARGYYWGDYFECIGW